MRIPIYLLLIGSLLAGCGTGASSISSTGVQPSQEIADAKVQYELAIQNIEGDRGEYPAKVLRGLQLLEKSAEQGYAPAQFKLGYYYQTGPASYDCLKQEPMKAYYWLEKAGEQNHPEAQYELAMLYNPSTGFDGFTDRAKYVHWMEKAADSNFPKALYQFGRMYEKGDSVPPDLNMARTLYQKAASKGDDMAKKALRRLKKE